MSEDPRNSVEYIASAAYKTLVDLRESENPQFRLPDYGFFREFIRPWIENAMVNNRLEEHETTKPELPWRRDRRRQLLTEKYRTEELIERRKAGQV